MEQFPIREVSVMRQFPLLLVAALSLAACATTRMSEPEKLALYSGHAGAPVKSIRYTNPISWDKVDDNHLLLTLRPREVWLLRVSGPCLDWGSASPTISISNQAGIVSAGFDRITTPGVPASCRIEEIRPVDIAGVRAATDAMAAD
jgi:uncharacterized protein DUF6491